LHAINYEAPSTLDQAVSILKTHGRERSSVLRWHRHHYPVARRRPPHRASGRVKKIKELCTLSFDAKKGLRLGAAVPCIEIYENEQMRRHYPGLTEAAHLIGSLQVQNRASVGGNLCNGSPAADTTPALIALGARAPNRRPQRRARSPGRYVVVSPGRTVLQPGELLVELLIAPPPPHSSDAYLRFIPRNEMDIAVVGVGAALTLDGDKVTAARIGLGAVAATPAARDEGCRRAHREEARRREPRSGGRAASEATSPIDDMRGTAEYRRHSTGVLTRRAVAIAADAREKVTTTKNHIRHI